MGCASKISCSVRVLDGSGQRHRSFNFHYKKSLRRSDNLLRRLRQSLAETQTLHTRSTRVPFRVIYQRTVACLDNRNGGTSAAAVPLLDHITHFGSRTISYGDLETLRTRLGTR